MRAALVKEARVGRQAERFFLEAVERLVRQPRRPQILRHGTEHARHKAVRLSAAVQGSRHVCGDSIARTWSFRTHEGLVQTVNVHEDFVILGVMADEQDPDRTRTITWDDPRPAQRKARELSGSEFFDQMRRGKISAPPFVHLLGMAVFDAGEGCFTMTLDPQECHYNPMGCVHGGVLSTLLDSVMSAAVHTALPAGKGYMTLEIKV